MAEADRLMAKADRLAAAGERLTAQFARELARVWRDAERELRRLVLAARSGRRAEAIAATRLLALRAQIREVLRAAGYDRAVAVAAQRGLDQMLIASLGTARMVEITQLVGSIAPTLEALRRVAVFDVLNAGDETAHALWRSMVQHLYSGRPVQDILDDLAAALDARMATVRTLFDTSMTVLGRQVEAVQTEDLGPAQPFLFVGPIDDLTRPFCLERVGRVFTRAAIDGMDNGQLPNPFLTGGGYNCRHSWLAVESAELRARVGSDERIPEVAAAVALAEQRRAERQRRRAA